MRIVYFLLHLFFPRSPAKVPLSSLRLSLSLSLALTSPSVMHSDNTQITGVVSQQQEGGFGVSGP